MTTTQPTLSIDLAKKALIARQKYAACDLSNVELAEIILAVGQSIVEAINAKEPRIAAPNDTM